MPSSLRHLSSRPKSMPRGQWRGAGYYYKRKGHKWQKWSRGKDMKRGSKRTVGLGRWKHTHDKRR